LAPPETSAEPLAVADQVAGEAQRPAVRVDVGRLGNVDGRGRGDRQSCAALQQSLGSVPQTDASYDAAIPTRELPAWTVRDAPSLSPTLERQTRGLPGPAVEMK
jgi:hypothetical protein